LGTATETVIVLSVAPPGGRGWGGGKFLIICCFILEMELANRVFGKILKMKFDDLITKQ
jgi:hypothetical protein